MERNILTMVKREAAKIKNTMTAEKLFQRPEIERQFKSMVDTLTQHYGERRIHIQLLHNEEDEMTAGTDGNFISMNTGNSLIMFFTGLYEKYMAALGMLFHEVSHILFSDFDKEASMVSVLENGDFYGELPVVSTKEEEELLEDMIETMKKPEYRGIFIMAYHYLSNIIADAHDEDKLIDEKGGIVEKGILTVREALQSTRISLESMKEKNYPKLSIVFNLCLQFCRWDQILMEEEEEGLKDELVQKVFQLANAMNNAKYTDDPEEKNNEINKMLFFLWPYIKEELEEQEAQQQQHQQSSDGDEEDENEVGLPSGGNPSSQNGPSSSVQTVIGQLAQGGQNVGGTNEVQNGSSSKTAKANSGKAGSGTQTANGTSSQGSDDGADPSQAMFESIVNEIAQEEAEQNVQSQMTQSTNMEIRTVSQTSTHKNKKVNIVPRTIVNETDILNYERMMTDLKPYARKLIREMTQVLRDAQAGDIQHGKLIGNRFEAEKSYREDGRCWANRKLPQDLPDMAISVLVDHSGSMWGERINSSMKASMLLYEFATALEIPVMVCGHDTTDNGIHFYTYTGFNKVNNNEKYRLAKMTSGSCNRDGMAIEIAANLLSKRQEEIKLLFIISDGQPNDDEYGGYLAYEDIKSIVRRYKKQGVEVIAAAIGSDKDRIKEIYGESFLDVTDLNRFPKVMARIVKKKIV